MSDSLANFQLTNQEGLRLEALKLALATVTVETAVAAVAEMEPTDDINDIAGHVIRTARRYQGFIYVGQYLSEDEVREP